LIQDRRDTSSMSVGGGAVWQALDTSFMLRFIVKASQVGADEIGGEACPVEVERIGC
jgi:hypothetical protein